MIGAFANRFVGWRVSHEDGLVHHCGRGVQYLSICYADRPADAGIEPRAGSAGDSYNNALAETVARLYRFAVIQRRGPWRTPEAVELITLDCVNSFDNRRPLSD